MVSDSKFHFDAPPPAPRFQFGEPIDDDALSDLIAEDARRLLREGRPVELSRYLSAYPDLRTLEVALDTAIEMTLQSMAQRGRASLAQCAAQLSQQFPELSDRIRIAAELSAAMNSTSLFNIISQCMGPVSVPSDFGPPLPDGRPRYDLREMLGQGSEGYVYLAVDRLLSDPTKPALAALKMLSERGAGSRRRLARHDEAVRARRVNHPNVIRAIDRGVWNSVQFAVFEYVQGNRLDTHAAQNRIPHRDAARIVAEVADGLHAIHLAGLIHCDLKPANVLMDSSGQARIADFGLAQYQSQVDADRDDFSNTESSHGYGTLAFVAPEQYRRLPGCLAPAADIYALGGLLYWLLTGEAPNGSTPDLARRHLTTEASSVPSPVFPASLKVSPDLQAICTRALSFNPKERYNSAVLLAADLRAFLELRPLEWTRPGMRRRLQLFARREPRVATLSVLTLLGILGGGIGATYSVSHARVLRAESDLAKLRAKEAKASQQSTLSFVRGTVRNAMTTLDSTSPGDLSSQWLPMLTVLESLGGPFVADLSDATAWQKRIDLAGILETEAANRGTTKSVEYLQWQLFRGFWLTQAGRYAEALAELDANIEGWNTLLPNDPYRVYALAVRDAAAVLGYTDTHLKAHPDEVAQLRTRLAKAAKSFAEDRRRDPARKLCLRALVRLGQPELGGDPAQLAEWKKQRDQMTKSLKK